MSAVKKILFVINPLAGGHKKPFPKNEVVARFPKNEWEVHFELTTEQGHASRLADEAVKSGYDAVIAVGGDGTVNEVARVLYNTNCKMGIIPTGSENGLARHHHIPLNISKALNIILNFKSIAHDSVRINEHLSFNVSGIGYDAHVAHLFGQNGKRGFNTYIKLVLKEFKNYKQHQFEIINGDERINSKGMLIAIANGSQFGNNARIAPEANTTDGEVNITLVKRMSGLQLPSFIYRVFKGKIADSQHAILTHGKTFSLKSDTPVALHIDGEPAGYSNHYSISSEKGTLQLIVP